MGKVGHSPVSANRLRPVTVWRELRRLDATEQRPELAGIITATQASDWAGYVMLRAAHLLPAKSWPHPCIPSLSRIVMARIQLLQKASMPLVLSLFPEFTPGQFPIPCLAQPLYRREARATLQAAEAALDSYH
jgi:hypothetical protein